MRLPDLENFVLLPAASGSSAGSLYELVPAQAFSKNSFVLLPYQNPQVKKITPAYYSVKNIKPFDLSSVESDNPASLVLKTSTPKQDYIENVRRLKTHIQQGDIYEINYCIRFYSEGVTIDPLAVFKKLHLLAKAPYAMLVKTGNEFIISASPELFLKKEGSTIFTKPIKGTIRRGKTPQEDLFLKQELQTSIKERTENVMAVDVARNDLSRFARKGSVQVNKLYNIETFETVHQMVSKVSCELKDNISFETIIDAAFPMASMTGAPKLKAMELTDIFEDFERGAYSGAMGLVDEEEDYTLSVIIRSIFYDQQTKKISICVGGAITYLSDPDKEYEECLLKATALLNVLNASIG